MYIDHPTIRNVQLQLSHLSRWKLESLDCHMEVDVELEVVAWSWPLDPIVCRSLLQCIASENHYSFAAPSRSLYYHGQSCLTLIWTTTCSLMLCKSVWGNRKLKCSIIIHARTCVLSSKQTNALMEFRSIWTTFEVIKVSSKATPVIHVHTQLWQSRW